MDLANSSGVVGRNLMDSVGSDGGGYFPQLEKMPAHNHDGVGGMHLYLPWWKFDRKNDFLRGYHTEFGGGRGMPGVGDYDDLCDEFEGYGASLKKECKKKYGTYIGFAGRGEMIPNENCYCEIDPNSRGSVGHPGASLSLEVERQRNQDGERHAGDVSRDRRGRRRNYLGSTREDAAHPYGLADGGVIIHEVGTARMGEHPATSVLNQYCQAHDVKNLFVTDGASFVTNADKNPTLTIMALTWRASDYLLDQAKKGNL